MRYNRKSKVFMILSLVVFTGALVVAGRLMANKGHDHHKEEAPELPSAKKEYALLMKKYLSPASSVRISGIVSVYDGLHPDVLKEKSAFVYFRKEHAFYSRMSFQQTLCDGRFFVQMDSLNQVLLITPIADSMQQQLFPDPMPMAEKLFGDTARFKMSGRVSGDDNLRSITLTSDFNPEIQSFTIYYSPVDYTMKSAEVRFCKNGRPESAAPGDNDNVWISRIDYNTTTGSDIDVHAMIGNIFSVHGHKLEPMPAYSNYRVIMK